MKILAVVAMAAVMLAGPAPSVADGQPTNSAPKPSSFVPHSHSSNHVYGAPIGAPIVGHAKTAHRKHATKSPGASTKRD